MASCAAPRMFAYNGTLCACDPGYYYYPYDPSGNGTAASCAPAPGGGWGDWQVGDVVAARNESLYFLAPVLSTGVVRRLTESQALLIEASVAALLAWLAFCAAVRFAGRDRRGERRLLNARHWVSRFDSLFDNSHWARDQQVLRKRKTELGGTCSIACLILFTGLLSVFLYQVIKRRSIEMHRVKPAKASDLLSFVNDLEFHITTVSGMSCAQAVMPSTFAMGTPGSVDFRVRPLPTRFTYTCANTSQGPAITFKCSGCRMPPRDHYVSWQFVDLPGQPAAAVGFQFNLTAKQPGNDEHVSFVNGTINCDGYTDDGEPRTFRGRDSNIVKIQLFPQIFNNLGNLKLLQPLVQDFIQGSAFSDVGGLNASLQNPGDGVVNTTLYISYLSDYFVEISNEIVVDPVTVLASIGGLYAFSVAICLCLMTQCEARIKKLRDEDTRMLKIRSKRRALRNWDKVRRFVMYTWDLYFLDPTDRSGQKPEASVMDSIHRTFHKRRKSIRKATADVNGPNRVPSDMGVTDIERGGEMQQPSSSRYSL